MPRSIRNGSCLGARPLPPTCRHSGLLYADQMQRRVLNLAVMVGLPVLIGHFIFDWIDDDISAAVRHFPIRAVLIVAVSFLWAVFREYRERKKRTVR